MRLRTAAGKASMSGWKGPKTGIRNGLLVFGIEACAACSWAVRVVTRTEDRDATEKARTNMDLTGEWNRGN